MNINRRHLLAAAAVSSASLALGRHGAAQVPDMSHLQHDEPKPHRPAVPRLPALICKVTATVGIDRAYQMLVEGSDTLEAAIQVCRTQEDDPRDHSNGLGGLPNARGEVQLDACCMHGPTRRLAAVASVSGIRNVSLLSRALMDHTGHALLVGADAQNFAFTQGFTTTDLLTDRTRQNYALWKQIRSKPDLTGTGIFDSSRPEQARGADPMPGSQRELDLLVHKLEPIAAQAGVAPAATWRAVFDVIAPAAEPLYVSTIDRKGQISLACTSSGLPWRTPGLASDVAVMGAGCFVDPDVGSAGSSGNAEANIKIAGAHTIIENMRKGMSPEDAGMDALRRIVRSYNNDITALRFIDMVYYILRKDGSYGSVSLWQGDRTGHVRQFTIKDGEGMRRTEDCLFLFPCSPINGCVEPAQA